MGKKLLHNLSSLFGFLLLGLSIWAIANELRVYNYRDVLSSLASLSPNRLYLAIGLTTVNYLVMTGYDFLACRYIRHPLSYPKVAFASFISHCVSNTVGFAFLTGSAIRDRFYSHWGLEAIAIVWVSDEW